MLNRIIVLLLFAISLDSNAIAQQAQTVSDINRLIQVLRSNGAENRVKK
jgi:hypothetical protein